jgi:hypothetical protein
MSRITLSENFETDPVVRDAEKFFNKILFGFLPTPVPSSR